MLGLRGQELGGRDLRVEDRLAAGASGLGACEDLGVVGREVGASAGTSGVGEAPVQEGIVDELPDVLAMCIHDCNQPLLTKGKNSQLPERP